MVKLGGVLAKDMNKCFWTQSSKIPPLHPEILAMTVMTTVILMLVKKMKLLTSSSGSEESDDDSLSGIDKGLENIDVISDASYMEHSMHEEIADLHEATTTTAVDMDITFSQKVGNQEIEINVPVTTFSKGIGLAL